MNLMGRRDFRLYAILGILGAAPLGIGYLVEFLWPHWLRNNEPFHATVEALGALAAILMCFVLLLRRQREGVAKYSLVALGFLGMGLLDGFHAVSPPGRAFVFLHSTAGLVGSLGFILAWSSALDRYAAGKKWFPWAVCGGSGLIASWAFFLPGSLPPMLDNGEFTPFAITINFVSCLLFFAAALRFVLDFNRSGQPLVLLFACLAILFGLSGLVFKYSQLWDIEWWSWHFLRLQAYLLALIFLGREYYRAQQELLEHRERLQELVDRRTNELQEINEELGQENLERKQAEEALRRVLFCQQQINHLQEHLLGPGTITQKIKVITDSVVSIFDADFCRIWILEPGDLCDSGCIHGSRADSSGKCRDRARCLHLLASSGRYTHIDGGHRRVPLGSYKIGRLAAGHYTKIFTNDVTHDQQVHNHQWAESLGLRAFAGYQLRNVKGESVGVLALFSKNSIAPEEETLLENLGNSTAQVIQASKVEDNWGGARLTTLKSRAI